MGLWRIQNQELKRDKKSIRHKKFKNRAEPGFLFFCFPDPVKALSEDIAGLGVDDVSVIRDGA